MHLEMNSSGVLPKGVTVEGLLPAKRVLIGAQSVGNAVM